MIQVSFMYVLKISARETMEISVKNITNITAQYKNVMNCQITTTNKVGSKMFKILSHYSKMLL